MSAGAQVSLPVEQAERWVLEPILQYPENAVDHDGLGDVFELSQTDLAYGEEADDTPCCLRTNEDRSRLTEGSDAGRHVR